MKQVKHKDEPVMSNPKHILTRWREYFRELLITDDPKDESELEERIVNEVE